MCRAWEKIKKDEYNRGAEVQKTKDDMKIAELKAKSDAERSEFIRREQILLQEIRDLKSRLGIFVSD